MIVVAIWVNPAKPADDGQANFSTVREWLQLNEFKASRQALVELGTRAFEAYHLILSDPDATDHEVSRIFGVLALVKGDRKPFLEHAVRSLANKDARVRWTAVGLLGAIGGRAEASPVVALLSDGKKPGDIVVVFSAAETLAAIGGPREVIAMDAWLLGGSHLDDKKLRAHVKRYRDELAARLAKEPKKK